MNIILVSVLLGVLAWAVIRFVIYMSDKQKHLQKKEEQENKSEFNFKDPLKPRDNPNDYYM